LICLFIRTFYDINKEKINKNKFFYYLCSVINRKNQKYDNYDAIEVPYTDTIPSDYKGIMEVLIPFLDKYCPERFEIIWQASGNTRVCAQKNILAYLKYTINIEDRGVCSIVNGKKIF
jgi:hypothetical protein